jgi:hypothetical protein
LEHSPIIREREGAKGKEREREREGERKGEGKRKEDISISVIPSLFLEEFERDIVGPPRVPTAEQILRYSSCHYWFTSRLR